MAKKKRRHTIKLNNRVKELFDGFPFDEGILKVEDEQLLELVMILDLKLSSYQSNEMIRALRRVWSEGEYYTRKEIIEYLLMKKRGKKRQTKDTIPTQDRVEWILSLVDEELTREEEEEILEHFIPLANAKITPKKIENRLQYIRKKRRLKHIQESLEVEIDSKESLSFTYPFEFKISKDKFTKYLLVHSPELDFKSLLEKDDKSVIQKLQEQKSKAIIKEQKKIDDFCLLLQEHCYLNQDEIIKNLKHMPIESKLYDTPIDYAIIERVLHQIDSNISIILSGEDFILEKDESLKIYDTNVNYKLKLYYKRSFIYEKIWRGDSLFLILNDFKELNNLTIENFNSGLIDLEEQMKEMSKGLDLEDRVLEDSILQFLEPQISTSNKLKIREKLKRRILYHFMEYIRPIREKKMRQELLAKTIRDFKQLFPIARDLKRRIIFHAGPTNSGKTYQAMERLKEAETGYYLAPLRLLALEGYEDLKRSNIAISLITGEEEIIDEESTHISSTIEMLNMDIEVECCVIDEIQMINDRDRGWAWANALIGTPAKEVILTGSTNAIESVKEICDYLGEELEIIYFERKNPLEIMPHPTSIDKIAPNTAIVAFSRKEVLSIKSKLSKRYSVSVVYGNLSPEVRREEARRFREGESQILVATDAIAMGLNLPIHTILFYKDNKFDGLRQRELTSSEILQIAGRAGRYRLHEKGLVGALDAKSLETIGKKFYKPLPKIKLPFAVMASLEHVLLIGEILETQNLLDILEFFAKNMEFDGPFRAGNIESMIEVARIVDEYEKLDLRSRYHLACAPVSLGSPYIESVFHRYLKHLAKGELVSYIPPRELPKFAITNDELLNAEDRVKEVSLYLWLSFKFPELFVDTREARLAREKLNRFIEASLQKGTLSKRCRKCGKELDFSYRFSICERCYLKGKRGFLRPSSYRRRQRQK